MRSLVPALVRTALVGGWVLLALASCSKKATAPNSRPVPEGLADGTMLMVGWPEQAVPWFTVADPSTPESPGDDFVSAQGVDYWESDHGVRSTTIDVSSSNQLQVFRVGSDGNSQELFDFFLTPSLRIIGRDTDLYEFVDPSPDANARYVSRGATSGIVTPSSPVTNEIRVTQPILEDLDFLPAPKGAANDSVLNVQWTEDARAAFYIVELNDANDITGVGSSVTLERRLRGIPSPLLPGSRSLHSVFTLLPAGRALAGFNITITSRVWPRAFYVRITAYDYNGQMINRLNDYFKAESRDGNFNLDAYEPTGGTIQLLDPYPNPVSPVPVPPIFPRSEVMAIYASTPNTAPVQPANLRFQLTPGSPPPSEVFTRLAQDPLFTVQALKSSIAHARELLANPPAAPQGRSAIAKRPH